MYDIGIIGGMGPQATAALFDLIVKHTEAESDQTHPDIIILNHTKTPDRTSFIMGNSKNSPLGDLEECFNHIDLKIVYPEDSVCDVVQKIIYDVKNTSCADETLLSCQLDVAMEWIENQLGDVTFLLACTKLSVLDNKYMKSHVVIDAMDILALSSIYMAGYKFKINGMNYNEFPLKKILEKR